jgi:glutathione S-transferase
MAFIPVVTTPEGHVWQDTSDILDRLEARHPNPPLYPETSLHRMVCALIELYSDEFSLTLAMHTRWGTEESEAMTRRRFGAMTGSIEQGNRAADQMVKLRYAVGASPEAGPAIDEHIHGLFAALSVHFEEHDYLLGARTSLADCALMGPLYAHVYTDLVSRRLLLETAVPIVRWIEFCNMPGASEQGEWMRADGISESLFAVLGVMGRDAVPMLLSMVRAVEAWADENAVLGEMPPRSIGKAEADLYGTMLIRDAQCYSLWMLQRVLDPYQSLPDGDRARVDDALAGSGWEALLAYAPRHRLEKRGYDLVFTDLKESPQ